MRTAEAAARSPDDPAGVPVGRYTVNVEPAPTRLSTSIRPPCASAITWLIASPSPVPPTSRLLAWSAR